MTGDSREACGRCGLTTVVDAATESTDGGAAPDGTTLRSVASDPLGAEHIVLPAGEVRAVARPAVWLGCVGRRLDAAAARLIYGR